MILDGTVRTFGLPDPRTIWLLMLANVAIGLTAAEPALRVRPAEWAQPVLGVPVENLHLVAPGIYRSAQPDDEGMAALAAAGMRTVLSLRDFHDDADEAKGTSLVLRREEMNAGTIEETAMRRALDVLRQAEKPVLVHCWHGADRTGAVVALYRMVDQGWTAAAAIDEMKHGRYGHHDGWYPNIEAWLSQVDPARYR